MYRSTPTRFPLWGLVALSLTVAGCASDGDPENPDDTPEADVIAACFYDSPFTGGEECREFSGDGWQMNDALSACSQLSGTEDIGGRCPPTYTLGTCVLDDATDFVTTIFIYGEDSADCDSQKMGCEVFGGGRWIPAPLCGEPGTPQPGGNVFIQPTLECRDPLAGEPAGQSEDGQVCTWQSISGSTEEGRRFSDYASCDVVRSQRPYYPIDPAPNADVGDERMADPAYVAELDWVKGQLTASACVCCHSTEDTPAGPSNWYLEAPGNWMNTFYDSGLAMGANFIRSDAFGAYLAEHNNGFARGAISGFPSTDPERMRDFFIAELAHRGLGAEDFADTPPFGGPIVTQLDYEPSACENGERVQPDGTVIWTGGPARYVYVLEAGGQSPTVPPNLDLPSETLWRLDVPADQEAILSGDIQYGVTPDNLRQRFPEGTEPTPLTPGAEYYLYVTRDVGQPITRCLFQY